MKVVALVNMKGGVAKTTLAVNLADYLSQRAGKKTLLIDIDPQFNATQCLFSAETYAERRGQGEHTVTAVFDDNPPANISAVSGSSDRRAIALSAIRPWKFRDDYDVLPGDLELHRMDMATGQGREFRLRRFLKDTAAAAGYDYVIIDAPPTPSHWMISALLASNHYLVPVRPEPLSRVGIDLLRGVINRCSTNYGHNIDCVGVVLTMTDRRTRVYTEAQEVLNDDPFWSGKKFDGDLPHRTRIARSQGEQQLILDTDVDDAKLALVRIGSEFLERLDDD